MKICIYQVALIVAIFSLSKSLYCKHSHHSVEPEHELVAAIKGIQTSMNDLLDQALEVDRLHSEASNFNSKDKSVSGVRRSRIKRAQSYSATGYAQKDREIHKTLHYLKKTQEQIDSAAHLMKNSNELTHEALSNIPAE